MAFDASLGMGITGGGNVRQSGARVGPALDVMLSRAQWKTDRESSVFAASLSLQFPWVTSYCVANLTPDAFTTVASGCGGGDAPATASVALLGGLQRGERGTARFLAGPAWIFSDRGQGLGFIGRMDLASAPAAQRVSVLFSLRGSAMMLDGSMYYLSAFALGLRLQ